MSFDLSRESLLYSSFEILPNRFNSFFYVIAYLRWSYYRDKHCGPGRHAVPTVRHLIIIIIIYNLPGVIMHSGLEGFKSLAWQLCQHYHLNHGAEIMLFWVSIRTKWDLVRLERKCWESTFEGKNVTSYDTYIRKIFLWRSGTKWERKVLRRAGRTLSLFDMFL